MGCRHSSTDKNSFHRLEWAYYERTATNKGIHVASSPISVKLWTCIRLDGIRWYNMVMGGSYCSFFFPLFSVGLSRWCFWNIPPKNRSCVDIIGYIMTQYYQQQSLISKDNSHHNSSLTRLGLQISTCFQGSFSPEDNSPLLQRDPSLPTPILLERDMTRIYLRGGAN